jgi:hypothetical protein
MQNTDFPFEKVWYGVDIEDIRPHQSNFSTYEGSPFDLLPTIDAVYLDGSFNYLSNTPVENLEERYEDQPLDITFKSDQTEDVWEIDAKWRAKLDSIQATLPTTLPAGLVKFMSARKAHGLIPSCTACYFDLPTKATPFQYLGENGFLFHFYRDQQDCVFWYYYVRTSGESCILTSAAPFGVYEKEDDYTDEIVQNNVFFTAHTFEEFIYRTWIENILWFANEDGEGFDENTQYHCELYRQRYGNNAK